MKPVFDDQDIALLQAAQNGISLVEKPFKNLAEISGMTEEEVISKLRKLKDNGVIRRFGASINNRKVGIKANAMVVWNVPKTRIEEVGEIFTKNECVTHCYTRTVVPGRWVYNLFTVLHSQEYSQIETIVREMSVSIGIQDYCILFSTREFKKTNNGRIDKKAISKITIGKGN